MFGRLADIPNAAWAEFEQLCSVRRFAPGEHLVFAGDRFQDLLFVADGLLRFYYADAAGRERNKSFDPAGTFCGPIASYLYDQPTPYSIQALEPSIVLSIGWHAFVNLCEQHRELERALLRLLAEVLARKEQRERMSLELDPPVRYLAFLKESAELAERLPNYHIASYLGITSALSASARLQGSKSHAHASMAPTAHHRVSRYRAQIHQQCAQFVVGHLRAVAPGHHRADRRATGSFALPQRAEEIRFAPAADPPTGCDIGRRLLLMAVWRASTIALDVVQYHCDETTDRYHITRTMLWHS